MENTSYSKNYKNKKFFLYISVCFYIDSFSLLNIYKRARCMLRYTCSLFKVSLIFFIPLIDDYEKNDKKINKE